jgi:hypothetical protein
MNCSTSADAFGAQPEMTVDSMDKDVEITLSKGLLGIHAERTCDKKEEQAAGRARSSAMGRSSGRWVFRTR